MPEKILRVRMDAPGDVGEVVRVLGKENVPLTAIAVIPGKRETACLLQVERVDDAFEALRTRGHLVDLVPAVLLMAPTLPGETARLFGQMQDAGVEIHCALTTREGRILVGVDNVQAAIDAVGGAAVAGR